jgi:hypothetical protein
MAVPGWQVLKAPWDLTELCLGLGGKEDFLLGLGTHSGGTVTYQGPNSPAS